MVTDTEARKEFSRKRKRCFSCLNVDRVSRNCTKSKPCFYVKGMHNSAICHNKKDKRDKTAAIDSSTNYASSFSSVILPTTEILLENPLNKQELKKTKNLEKVSVHLKSTKEKFEVVALCTLFICLPIQRQSSNFAKQNFDYLKELELANSESKNDIDLLIGSDSYWLLVTGNVKFGNPGESMGVETKFGWVLNGLLKGEDVNGPSNINFVSEVSSHILFINSDQKSESLGLENKLDCFWDLESIGILDNKKHSQEHFIESIYLNEKTRNETKLLFKENHALLHDHFDLCRRSSWQIEARPRPSDKIQ